MDSKGVLWVGTEKGLDAFDPIAGSFRTYRASGLSQIRVRDIAQDSQGALWIAARATGLLRRDPVTRQLDPGLVAEGRAGPYGLPGMHERATRIGAQLNIWTGIGAGTEIELSIAGSIAYGTSPVGAGFRPFRR